MFSFRPVSTTWACACRLDRGDRRRGCRPAAGASPLGVAAPVGERPARSCRGALGATVVLGFGRRSPGSSRGSPARAKPRLVLARRRRRAADHHLDAGRQVRLPVICDGRGDRAAGRDQPVVLGRLVDDVHLERRAAARRVDGGASTLSPKAIWASRTAMPLTFTVAPPEPWTWLAVWAIWPAPQPPSATAPSTAPIRRTARSGGCGGAAASSGSRVGRPSCLVHPAPCGAATRARVRFVRAAPERPRG